MKRSLACLALVAVLILTATCALAAYEHAGEADSPNFLAAFPTLAGTKLDSCALCHSGGSTVNSRGREIHMGSCQWCHSTYGYDGSGNIVETLNAYGLAYFTNGRTAAAITAINGLDSDGDGYTNQAEIAAMTYPGNAEDDPTKVAAPKRIYTLGQIKALPSHTQFLLMNTSRSGDFYAEYTGVTMETLLADAGLLASAQTVSAYAPDGYSTDYTINPDPTSGLYYVNGAYPQAAYQYDEQADQALNADGWCDYSSASNRGRNAGDLIQVENGLRMILAYAREGLPMDAGVLDDSNNLDGEGPFRAVPPQMVASPPDQSSTSAVQDVIWPYTNDWDHNAGFSARTVTLLKVGPLPAGTTDIDVLEAGWVNADLQRVTIYGAIDGSDSNGNGVLDSEEGADATRDYNGNGTPDFQDPLTASLRHVNGIDKVIINASAGALAGVQALLTGDAAFGGSALPAGQSAPFGAFAFKVTDLTAGGQAALNLALPSAVPAGAQIHVYLPGAGWTLAGSQSRASDTTLNLTLTDGGANDADGQADGVITVQGVAVLRPAS